MAEAIIGRILEDAKQAARERVREAQARADEILESARRRAEAHAAELKTRRALAARENEERIRAIAESEHRFARLRVRQTMAQVAFDKSVRALASLPKAQAEAFWGGLLEKYGEEGDEVIFSAEERALDAAFVSAVSERCGKRFSPGAAGGNFRAGMILRGPDCDKNLTAEMLVREFREREEIRVLGILFGD